MHLARRLASSRTIWSPSHESKTRITHSNFASVTCGKAVGIKYREVARRLRLFGFAFDRLAAGSHELWRHADTGRKVVLPHHSKEMAEGTLRAILREANIEVEDFLRM
ncbi:MAG: type II toxin-antitoxin system HicA family toxin [Candidatus Kapaibacterium sp.]